jgi:type III secretion system FlhB-like substrate exporter
MHKVHAMREQDQPANLATVAADEPEPIAPALGLVARQLLKVVEDRGLKLADGQELAELLAGLKLDGPIPLEAMATVSGILLLLFRAEARFAAGEDRR